MNGAHGAFDGPLLLVGVVVASECSRDGFMSFFADGLVLFVGSKGSVGSISREMAISVCMHHVVTFRLTPKFLSAFYAGDKSLTKG